METADLPEYPADCIDEAISICPEDCLAWVGED
jgi:ferredoxin